MNIQKNGFLKLLDIVYGWSKYFLTLEIEKHCKCIL